MFCASDLGLDTSEFRIARGDAGYIWAGTNEELREQSLRGRTWVCNDGL